LLPRWKGIKASWSVVEASWSVLVSQVVSVEAIENVPKTMMQERHLPRTLRRFHLWDSGGSGGRGRYRQKAAAWPGRNGAPDSTCGVGCTEPTGSSKVKIVKQEDIVHVTKIMMQERAVEPTENVPKIMMQERAVETTENVTSPTLQEDIVHVTKIMMQERAVESIENVTSPTLQEDIVHVTKIMMQERAVEPIENVPKTMTQERHLPRTLRRFHRRKARGRKARGRKARGRKARGRKGRGGEVGE
jgi:hypothetical protein